MNARRAPSWIRAAIPLKRRALFQATPVLVLASLATGCSSGRTDERASALVSSGYTLAPGEDAWVSLKAAPHAVCKLVPDEAGVESLPADDGELDADENGMVHVSVRIEGPTEEPIPFVLQCEADGAVTSSPVVFRSASSPTAAMPAPEPRRDYLLPGSRSRAALTEDRARQLSDEELEAGGYPVRPSAVEAPQAYARWLRLVSQDVVLDPPVRAGTRRARHGRATGARSATDYNWSGFVAQSLTDHTYEQVDGDWVIPAVKAETLFNTWEHSVIWVGIDGFNVLDLIQVGTEQDAITYKYPGRPFVFVHQEYAFTEVVPMQNEQGTSLQVVAGDEVACNVWIGDNTTQTPNPSGAYADFTCQDMTTGHATTVRTPLGTVAVRGAEASWILEQPFSNQQVDGLPNFGTVFIKNPSAERVDRNPPWVSFDDPRSTMIQITMVGGNDAHNRDTVTAVNTDQEIQFTWLHSL